MGGWERMELDKYELLFGLEGGENTIIVSNYPGILNAGIYGITQDVEPVDGIDLRIEGNKVIVSVSPSTTPRSWMLRLAFYDASSDPVYVYQK